MNKRILVVIAAVLAAGLAVALVVTELRDQPTRVPAPTQVDPGESVTVPLARDSELSGQFRLESAADYPALVPTDEYTDEIAREDARVVVAVLSCECDVSDDVVPPTMFATDTKERRWEAVDADVQSFAEVAGLEDPRDIGEIDPIRFAAVFVVPEDVADEVDVLLVPAGDKTYQLNR